MEKQKKEKRSSKWTFIIYKESVPENYLDILEELQVPFVLSPWHDKDVDRETGEIKKAHKHGALFFDSLKSYSQVSDLISENLNAPKHVEPVHSPKGMYDYFIHAQSPDKAPYNIEDIESGSGFDIAKFLMEQESGTFLNTVIDIIEEQDFINFDSLVSYARKNNSLLLSLIVDKTYFFARLLDSRKFRKERNSTRKATKNVGDEDE